MDFSFGAPTEILNSRKILSHTLLHILEEPHCRSWTKGGSVYTKTFNKTETSPLTSPRNYGRPQPGFLSLYKLTWKWLMWLKPIKDPKGFPGF